MAVAQAQYVDARGGYQYAANDGQLRHQLRRNGGGAAFGYEVEQSLRAEQYGCRPHHTDAVGGGEHGGADKVERGVGEEIRVVALQSRHYGSKHGEGTIVSSDCIYQF